MNFRKMKDGTVYGNDVPFQDFVRVAALAAFITALICLVISILTWLLVCETYREDCKRNEIVEIVNQLPVDEREDLTSYLGEELDDTTRRMPKVEPKSASAFFKQYSTPIWLTIIFIILTVASLATTWHYGAQKNDGYFYADLPYRGVKGTVMFLLLWISWPGMLISFFCMQKKRRKKQKLDQERAQTVEQACEMATQQLGLAPAELAKLSSEEIDRVLEKVISQTLTRKIKEDNFEDFRKMRSRNNEHARSTQADESRQHIERLQSAIKECAEKMQNYQREIGREQARLRELEKQPDIRAVSDEQIAREWQELQTMRGVYGIVIGDHDILLKVRVCVPYEGVVYDFGDYYVVLDPDVDHDGFVTARATEVRSGRIQYSKTRQAIYRKGESVFCLSNLDLIHRYLRENNLIAATALVIDSLHYVNPGDRAAIPKCFRAIQDIEEINNPKMNTKTEERD